MSSLYIYQLFTVKQKLPKFSQDFLPSFKVIKNSWFIAANYEKNVT